MDQVTLEYAVLASSSYVSSRTIENIVSAPAGWQVLKGKVLSNAFTGDLGHVQNLSDGFEATACFKGDEIIISFAGTNQFDFNEWLTDLDIGAAGSANSQILDAALYYKMIQEAYPDKTISFTGHSLGGGLAALMGVFFDKKAVTFDPAPFRLAATEQVATQIETFLAAQGYGGDADLASYATTEIPLSQVPGLTGWLLGYDFIGSNSYPTVIRGEENISVYVMDGEFLTNGVPGTEQTMADLRIMGSFQSFDSDYFASSLTTAHYHTMELLTLTMADSRLSEVAKSLPDLFANMVDGYFDGLWSLPTTSFPVRLIQLEYDTAYGGVEGGRGVIKAFTDDLVRLAQTSGENATTEIIGDRSLQNAMMGLLMDHVYTLPPTGALTPYFDVNGGTIAFDSRVDTQASLVTDFVDNIDSYFGWFDRSSINSDVSGKGELSWHFQYDMERAMNLTTTGSAADVALGSALNDIMHTGAGNDIMYGGDGNDLLDGGSGIDIMRGGAGNDTYVVDSLSDVVDEGWFGGSDTINSSISYTLSSNFEHLTLTGSVAINGTGNDSDNVMNGNSASNVLTANGGNDVLNGYAGNDLLVAGSGADILTGGTGNDTLKGNSGNDVYQFGRGAGQDTIYEDELLGGYDILSFASGISASQLWFSSAGNDLKVSVIGTSDNVLIKNWYSYWTGKNVEAFTLSNGLSLACDKVSNLVSAMAAFSPPSAGQTTLSTSYQTALNPVIAANWA